MYKTRSQKYIVLITVAFLCIVSLASSVSALSDVSPRATGTLKQDVGVYDGPEDIRSTSGSET
ncbi:MAG: hypothetical protein NTV84_01910, partial [Methanoregula sp.]|nr:hypothetical protein [Methanoregula sp.]